MATIFKDNAIITGSASNFNTMQDAVTAYWINAEFERASVIPYWKAKQLISASSVEEIALKVTDITNLTLVESEWVVFEEGDETSLSGRFRPNDYYYVVGEATIESIRGAFSDVAIQNLYIGGRLGKISYEEDGETIEQIHAFVYGFECKPVPPGGGGDGASSGVRIPPRL